MSSSSSSAASAAGVLGAEGGGGGIAEGGSAEGGSVGGVPFRATAHTSSGARFGRLASGFADGPAVPRDVSEALSSRRARVGGGDWAAVGGCGPGPPPPSRGPTPTQGSPRPAISPRRGCVMATRRSLNASSCM
uniref:Uncharacterized protein n=1 Tax=Human herpesvirus 1 TaxID=10298 RepID=A0A2U9AAC0_HHV1|nr:hypothetical protein [Human alphaherpesvirus 1]